MTTKIVLSSVAVLSFASAPALAGDCPSWSDDFESYAAGPIGNQGAWELWGVGSPPLDSVVLADPTGSGQGNVLEVSAVQDAVVRFEQPEACGEPLITGAHNFSTLIYNGSDQSDVSYFIMLNFYDQHTVGTATNWAVQVQMDRGAGVWLDDGASGASTPLVLDQWNLVEVLVDVDNNNQFFFINGEVFYTGGWAGHVSADPGFAKLDALDYWGNGAGPVLYDESAINYNFETASVECPSIVGACCLVDGTCLPDADQATCEATEGYYSWSLFAPCTGDTCAAYVPGEGWGVTAPIVWTGDTTFQAQECGDLGIDSPQDELLLVTIPYTAPWTFSICDGAAFDTYLAIGSTACGTDIATNDDACGLQSEISLVLEPGDYYVTVAGVGAGEEGAYTLTIDAPCVQTITPAGDPESELCGDDTNGGCNMATPGFEPIAIGQMITGTMWIDEAGTRDTDWYEFTNLDGALRWAFVGATRVGDVIECSGDLAYNRYNVLIAQSAAGADTVMSMTSESSITYGMIADADTNPSTDCATVAFISPAFFTSPCTGTGSTEGVIEAGAVECVPSNGDTDGDGDVDVNDLLNVIGNWGATGDPGTVLGDTTCDGVVNINDLLDVTGNWD
jgi:hypothetical protein